MMRIKKGYNLALILISILMVGMSIDLAYSLNLRPALRSNPLSEKTIKELMYTVKEIEVTEVEIENGKALGLIMSPEDIRWEGVTVKHVLNPGVYQDELNFPGKIFLFPRVVVNETADAKGERYVSHIGFAVLEKTTKGYKLSILNKPVLSPSYEMKNGIKVYKDGIVAYEDPRIVTIDDNIILQCTEAKKRVWHLAFHSITKKDFKEFYENPYAVTSLKNRLSFIKGHTKNGNIIKRQDGTFFTYLNFYYDEKLGESVLGCTAPSLSGPWKIGEPIKGLEGKKYLGRTGESRVSIGSPSRLVRIDGKDYLFSICNESYVEGEKKFYRPIPVLFDANDPTKVIYRGSKALFETDKVSDGQKWHPNYDVRYVCGIAHSKPKDGPLTLKDKIFVPPGEHDHHIKAVELYVHKCLKYFLSSESVEEKLLNKENIGL
ncbi:hypothetical protein ACFL2G_04090 [Candidatus Omnitrophota bacterium]